MGIGRLALEKLGGTYAERMARFRENAKIVYEKGYNERLGSIPQTPFQADYPTGAITDGTGRLSFDIDNRAINPSARIVGRNTS